MSIWIEKNIEFQATHSISECKKLTLDFFNGLGFKNSNTEMDTIEFKRGSEILNGFTTNALRWMSKIQVNFEENLESVKVIGNFKINTKNQLATQRELQIWNLLVEDYKNSLLTGEINLSELTARNQKVQKGVRTIILWALLGTALGGGLGTFLAAITDFILIIPIATISYAIMFLIGGIKRTNNCLTPAPHKADPPS